MERDLPAIFQETLLNESQLENILALDFQKQLFQNPPIQDTFSPEEELSKIKKLPHSQKKLALPDFKDKLKRQNIAWANCRITIERLIEFNQSTPKGKLMEIVEKYGSCYGFTREQKEKAEKLIESFFENRKKVSEILKKLNRPTALVKELSGVDFDDTPKFEITQGPMFVIISTNPLNAERIYKRSAKVNSLLKYGGFTSKSLHTPPVPYIVINTRSPLNTKNIYIHEYEHQKNVIFQEVFKKQKESNEETAIFNSYKNEKDLLKKKNLLERYFYLKRKAAFKHAKDEVLAMKKDGLYYSYDFFFTKDHSPYDYLYYLREFKDEKNNQLWQETANKILVEEYRMIFECAIDSFDKLTESGYTKDEAIALLADKEFHEWPKAVKRLLYGDTKPKLLSSKS